MIWKKSQTEIEQEKQGYRLFSNYDPCFSIGGRTKIVLDIEKFALADDLNPNKQIHLYEAYDCRGFPIEDGESYYLHAPKLIVESKVVERDFETLEDTVA